MQNIRRYDRQYRIAEISARVENDKTYVFKINGQKDEKPISFEYVAYKAKKLSEWLDGMGLAHNRYYAAMTGTIQGLRVMFDIEADVIRACKSMGVKCDAMLCGGLVGLEGLRVSVDIAGREYKGEALRMGECIEGHFIRREGVKFSRYLKAYEVGNIKVL